MLLPPASVMASWPTPNYVNPETRGPAVFVVNIMLMIVVLVVVGIRFYTRLRVTRTFGPDDVLIAAALIPAIGLAAITIDGYGHSTWNRHIWDVVPSTLSEGRKIEVAEELLYCTASILTKLSLACFYLHLISNSGRKTYERVIYTSMVVFVAEWISFTVVALVQCRPLRAYWDIEPLYPYSCVDIGIFTLICGVLNVVTDFVCLFLPVPMIWNMNRPLRQRIAILAMFCSGLMTCATGVARTILVDYVLRKTYDTTWYLYPKNLATALEIDIGLICASLPALRALYLEYSRRAPKKFKNEKFNFSWLRPVSKDMELEGSYSDDSEARGIFKYSNSHTEEVDGRLTP